MRAPALLFTGLTALAACGGGGSSGDDDGEPDASIVGEDRVGCDGATFLGSSAKPDDRGPWDVGARTVTVGRLNVEIWYPAAPGSAAGQSTTRYDIRQALSPSMRDDIPDDDNPWQACDCYRDLPLDEAHGPYPVVVFVHGTAAFRHQSLPQVTHWASRGFVVIAADHPGLMLGDIDALLAAVAAPAGDLAFLAGRVDATRVGVAGHSAGGGAAAAASTKPGVRVVIPLAGAGTTAPSDSLDTVLYMGGMADTIAQWSNVSNAWSGSPTPRYLVGLTNAGHLAFSDLCETRNAQDQNLIQIAEEHALCGSQFAGVLFDCNESYLDGPTGWEIINHATTSVLEASLQCRGDLPPLSGLRTAYPDVGEYNEAL